MSDQRNDDSEEAQEKTDSRTKPCSFCNRLCTAVCSVYPRCCSVVRALNHRGPFISAIATAVIAVLALFQWLTLDKAIEDDRTTQRAYVFVTSLSRAKYPPNDPRRFAVTARIENVGGTPAQKVQVRFHCLTPDVAEIEKEYRAWFNDPSDFSSPQTMAPKQAIEIQACEFPAPKVDQAGLGKIAAIIVGEITYQDVFSESVTRVTQIMRRLNFDDSYKVDGGHSFGFMKEHNCADDDCPGNPRPPVK